MDAQRGERLPAAHGAPARLLVPGRYGMKNLKWLREIAFVDSHHVSWWTTHGGWSEAAPYRPNAMIASPREGQEIAAGEDVLFLGTAYAGRDPVEKVEVSLDGGPWKEAQLDYHTGLPDIWVLWSFAWTAEEGDHSLQARCTTASGAQSVLDPAGTDRKQGYDGSMVITLTVKA
ncbi:MAG: molybdopterin-dependent oxidoreductase [Myxococcota bacterium]